MKKIKRVMCDKCGNPHWDNKRTYCEHDFRYSHIEYPPQGTYTFIPPNREVVICRKCGIILKTNMI